MHVLLSSFLIPSLRSDDNHHSEDISLLSVVEKEGAEKNSGSNRIRTHDLLHRLTRSWVRIFLPSNVKLISLLLY